MNCHRVFELLRMAIEIEVECAARARAETGGYSGGLWKSSEGHAYALCETLRVALDVARGQDIAEKAKQYEQKDVL